MSRFVQGCLSFFEKMYWMSGMSPQQLRESITEKEFLQIMELVKNNPDIPVQIKDLKDQTSLYKS